MIQSAKLVGAELAAISLAGSGVGIGVVFASSIGSIARNPTFLKQLFLKRTNLLLQAHVFFANAASTEPASVSSYALYVNLTPTKLAVILVGTLVLAYVVFLIGYKTIPVEDLELRLVASLALSALFATGNVYFVLSKIPFYNNFTAYAGLMGAAALLFGGNFIFNKAFRESILRIGLAVFDNFVIAVEDTIQIHFGEMPPLIGHYLFFLYYFLMLTVVGAFVEICILFPWAYRTSFVFIVLYLARYAFQQRFNKKNYNSKVFVANVMRGSIVAVLSLSIFSNTTFFAVIIFLTVSYICYFHGQGRTAFDMERYKQEYVRAIPKIDQLDPFTRSRVKYMNWCVTLFPLFQSYYFPILVYGAASAILVKISFYSGLESAFVAADNEMSGGYTATLFLLLFLALDTFLFFVMGQYFAGKFFNKERLVLQLLIDLTSHDAVCAIVGNTAGKKAAVATAAQAFEMSKILGPVGVLTYLGALAQQDINTRHNIGLNAEIKQQITDEASFYPDGVVPVTRRNEIRENAYKNSKPVHILGYYKDFIGGFFGWGENDKGSKK